MILRSKYIVSEEEDPFVDIDDTIQLGYLIQSGMGEWSCSAVEYTLPMCADFDCEENLLKSLNDNPNSDTGDSPNSDTEEVDYDLLQPPPKLTCFKQAIEALVFLEHRGYVEQATSIGKVMIDLAGISVNNYTQTTIDQYLRCWILILNILTSFESLIFLYWSYLNIIKHELYKTPQ